MTDIARYRGALGASWRERRGLRQMQQALSHLQQLQHQEHGRCRLLARELAVVTDMVTRWQANRETVVAAARTDLLTQVDAELTRLQVRQQDAEHQLSSQRELLSTLDARVAQLQQRFLAIGERWPVLRPTEPASARIWRQLQRYEQQFVSAERRLPFVAAALTSAALTPPTAVDTAIRTGKEAVHRDQ